MKFLKELFKEDGTVSMMRLLSLISLLTGCALAIAGKDNSVMIFVTAAFSGKVAQKFVETKSK